MRRGGAGGRYFLAMEGFGPYSATDRSPRLISNPCSGVDVSYFHRKDEVVGSNPTGRRKVPVAQLGERVMTGIA